MANYTGITKEQALEIIRMELDLLDTFKNHSWDIEFLELEAIQASKDPKKSGFTSPLFERVYDYEARLQNLAREIENTPSRIFKEENTVHSFLITISKDISIRQTGFRDLQNRLLLMGRLPEKYWKKGAEVSSFENEIDKDDMTEEKTAIAFINRKLGLKR